MFYNALLVRTELEFQSLMKYVQLGKTGIRVSAIGFGAWAIGGPNDLFGIPVGWSAVTDDEAERTLLRAWELGINFFDTADVYGNGRSEELIGRYLHEKNTVIATKVGNGRRDGRAIKDFSVSYVRTQLEASLRRLRRDSVDLYQLHNPPPDVWKTDDVFELLNRLKQEGKIRACGVSISTMEEGIHLIETVKADVLQVLFNVLNQEPARELLAAALSRETGLLARVPLASGLLTGKFTANHLFAADDNRRNYLSRRRLSEAIPKVEKFKQISEHAKASPNQVALAFLLHHNVVPIPGARNALQVEENVAAENVKLDDKTITAIKREFSAYNFYLRYKVHI